MENKHFVVLDQDDMLKICGGMDGEEPTLLQRFGQLLGFTAGAIYNLSKMAGEYQASLPPSLKK